MSGVESEEGPRFGPLRPDRRVAVPSEQSGRAGLAAQGAEDPSSPFGVKLGSVAAWLAAGFASVTAAALLLMIWSGSADGYSQGRDSLIVIGTWLAVLIFVVARDRGRALRVFNVLALLCALIFVAIVVLAIIQFLRLAGEA